MTKSLKDKTIVLGVSGGIAAYKAAELVRLLTASGARVRVMMTRNARKFVAPLTFQALSGNPVALDTFSLAEDAAVGHIGLADSADSVVIAPATANVIAKAAAGIADDLLTTVLLATRCPVGFAPAMNVHMYEHPSVRENLERLRARGATIIEPGEGELACGYTGAGRLAEPGDIVQEIARMVSPQDLSGERVLVTAGPTREALDPVRFISNHSSGRMGFAVARAAWRRGAEVRLIAGPCSLPTPRGVARIDTVSARQMLDATAENFPWCTVLVMAAAVADFRPVSCARHKVKKDPRGLQLALAPIADELPRLTSTKDHRIVVGFAAETENLEANAAEKLATKGLDLIVANDVTAEGAGFAVETNIVTIKTRNAETQRYPLLSKDEVADEILNWVLRLRRANISAAS